MLSVAFSSKKGGDDMSKKKPAPIIVAVRMPESQLDAVDDWRRAQPRIPGLAAAVRMLIDQALAGQKAERAA
jgi:hypothetical protein